LRTAPTPNTEVLSIIHEAPRSSKSPLDKIFVSAWSYDPRTLTPIIAFGGEKGTIYLWRWRKGRTGDADGEEGGVWERLRVLRGHGGDVYALAFHPFHPHILASASNDLTIRLWSIFASDPPPDTYSAPPIAEGDEGDTLVCVLAGGGKGGHNQAVLSVVSSRCPLSRCIQGRLLTVFGLDPLQAFHPTLPLLATGGVRPRPPCL
jgi:WD40 repeat protein